MQNGDRPGTLSDTDSSGDSSELSSVDQGLPATDGARGKYTVSVRANQVAPGSQLTSGKEVREHDLPTVTMRRHVHCEICCSLSGTRTCR